MYTTATAPKSNVNVAIDYTDLKDYNRQKLAPSRRKEYRYTEGETRRMKSERENFDLVKQLLLSMARRQVQSKHVGEIITESAKACFIEARRNQLAE